LKAGERGPTLLEDFIFRQKIQRFDHERVGISCILWTKGHHSLTSIDLTGSRARRPCPWCRCPWYIHLLR
jgi:catalase